MPQKLQQLVSYFEVDRHSMPSTRDQPTGDVSQISTPGCHVAASFEWVFPGRGQKAGHLQFFQTLPDTARAIGTKRRSSRGTQGGHCPERGEFASRQEHATASNTRAYQREPGRVDEILICTPRCHPQNVIVYPGKSDLAGAADKRGSECLRPQSHWGIYHQRSVWRNQGGPMSPFVECQGGNSTLHQISRERRIAVAGGRILVRQNGEWEVRPCIGSGIGQRTLQNQSVPRRDGHFEWRQVHTRPSCLIRRCQSGSETMPWSLSGVRVARISARLPSIRRSRSSVIIRAKRCSYSSGASFPSFRWLLSFFSSSATRAGVTGLSAPPCWSAVMRSSRNA